MRTLTLAVALVFALSSSGTAQARDEELGPGLRRLDLPPAPEPSPMADGPRDPFRSYLSEGPRTPRPVIELAPLRSIRLRAMLWDVEEPKAVVALNAAEHVIRVGTKLGREGGIVTAIDGTCVVVEQSYDEESSEPETVRLCLHFARASSR